MKTKIVNHSTENISAKENENFVFDQVMLNENSLSDLHSILNGLVELPASKSASVKFMITKQDETELHSLGYSKEQIDKLRPDEAVEIIKNATKA